MKRLMLCVTALALVATGFLARHKDADAQVAPTAVIRTVNILFDGYCDGLTAKILANRIVRGNQTCCLSSAVKGRTFSDANGSGFYIIDTNLDSQWYIYESGSYGGQFWVYTYPGGEYQNDGTWSNGSACRAAERASNSSAE